MAISDAIKKYLAEKYGVGSVTEAGCDELGLACMTGGALKTPIPSGHSRADICKAEVYDWCYANLGYTPPVTPPVTPPAKGYLKVNSNPTGAQVVVGGISCGETPIYSTCLLNPGTYNVTISKAGYNSEFRSVTIISGGIKDLGTIQLTPIAGTPPVTPPSTPSVYVEPTSGAIGYFALCSHPGGATIKIDGATVSGVAPLCPSFKNVKVSANVSHSIVYTLMDHDDAEIPGASVPAGGISSAIQYVGVMSAIVGGHAGYVLVKAHDEKTGNELRARPAIEGITAEERHLTPYRVNLAIASTKNYKDCKIGVTYPGYEKAERTVKVTTSHTVLNPLVVDFAMKAARVWKEVEVLAEATQPAWITAVTIPSPLIWGSQYDLKIKFVFYRKTKYRSHIDFHVRPANWDGSLESLPAATTRISSAETGQLDPWAEENIYTILTTWTCTSAVPEGIYVIVGQLDYEG